MAIKVLSLRVMGLPSDCSTSAAVGFLLQRTAIADWQMPLQWPFLCTPPSLLWSPGHFRLFPSSFLNLLQRTEPFSSFFSSSFSNLCNKRTHLKWHFLQFQSCVDASLDKMGWINASFVHAKKKIKGDLTIPIFWEFFLLFTRSWNWMMLWGNLEGNDGAMILLRSFFTSEWLK